MLDIKFVRENPEVVKQNIRNKFQDNKLELVDKSSGTGQRESRNQTGSRSSSCREK